VEYLCSGVGEVEIFLSVVTGVLETGLLCGCGVGGGGMLVGGTGCVSGYSRGEWLDVLGVWGRVGGGCGCREVGM